MSPVPPENIDRTSESNQSACHQYLLKIFRTSVSNQSSTSWKYRQNKWVQSISVSPVPPENIFRTSVSNQSACHQYLLKIYSEQVCPINQPCYKYLLKIYSEQVCQINQHVTSTSWKYRQNKWVQSISVSLVPPENIFRTSMSNQSACHQYLLKIYSEQVCPINQRVTSISWKYRQHKWVQLFSVSSVPPENIFRTSESNQSACHQYLLKIYSEHVSNQSACHQYLLKIYSEQMCPINQPVTSFYWKYILNKWVQSISVCLCWGFTAQSTQWGHVERGQFT